MITPQQARDRYEAARIANRRATANYNTAKSQRTRTSNAISSARTEKRNLEERVQDLRRIIRKFDNDIEDRFKKTNSRATDANEAYAKAAFCVGGIANSSIATAFPTATVQGNTHTQTAYNTCIRELRRVENAIVELEAQIRTLNTTFNNLSADMRRYSNTISNSAANMRYYRGLM